MANFMTVSQCPYNPYLYEVKFADAKNQTTKSVQKQKALNHFVELSVCEFLKSDKQAFNLVLNYLKQNQDGYNFTVEEFWTKYGYLCRGLEKLVSDLTLDNYSLIPDRVLTFGYAIPNEKFYEDMCSLKFSASKYIGMISILSEKFQHFM